MEIVLPIVLPVFATIWLGWLIRRIGLVDGSFFVQTNSLVFYVCLPLLLVYKIGTADFAASVNLSLILGTGLAISISFIAAFLFGRMRGYAPAILGAFSQGSFRGNLAYIGLAIIYNGFGDAGLARAGVLLGFLVPLLNVFAILALTLPNRKTVSPRSIFLQMIGNPLIIASLIGIGWSYLHIPMPLIVDRFFHIATSMTLPLALLAIGGNFSLARMRGNLATAALATTMKLLILPLIAAVLLLLLGVRGMDLGIGLIMAGAPAAVTTYIMADQMGGDAQLAGSIVVMSTMLSLVTYTLLLFCLQQNAYLR
jgi:predicted permease